MLIFLLGVVLSTQSFAQTPCACCSEEHRQFDFWEGDWEVVDSTGKILGYNHIVLMQDSCVLQENWSSGKGAFSGTSYNFYHSGEKVWKQLWINNQGGSLELSGNWNGQAMVLSSAFQADTSGNKYQSRVTWTPLPDGRVRQLWDIRSEEGKRVQVVFDGYYQARKED